MQVVDNGNNDEIDFELLFTIGSDGDDDGLEVEDTSFSSVDTGFKLDDKPDGDSEL